MREPRPTRGTAQAEYVLDRGLAVGIEAAASCHLVLTENWVEALEGAPSRAHALGDADGAPSVGAPSNHE